MRLLWARAGVPYSPATGLPIEAQTVSQMVDRVAAMPEGTRLLLLAPVVRDRKGEYRKELAELQRRGFTRVKVDGKLYEIGEVPALNRKVKHEIEAVVDRIVVRDGHADAGSPTVSRPRSACPTASSMPRTPTPASAPCSPAASPARSRGFTIEEIEPRLFSFNSPHGACPACDGLGVESFFDPALVVPDERAGAGRWRHRPLERRAEPLLRPDACTASRGTSRSARARRGQNLPERVRDAILNGTGEDRDRLRLQGRGARLHGEEAVRGRAAQPPAPLAGDRQRLGARGDVALPGREALCRLPRRAPQAGGAGGARRRQEHRAKPRIFRSARRSTGSAACEATLTPQRREIARRILREIVERLQFLVDVGLDYLTLARGSATLSGGESQRIRLASQIGSGLTGVLYVLDEPSIGLHQRDNERLLGTLRRLKALGNTVLVVEHDEDAIRAADHLIDMGPAAGVDGGHVVAEGTPAEVAANPALADRRLPLGPAPDRGAGAAAAGQTASAWCAWSARAATI